MLVAPLEMVSVQIPEVCGLTRMEKPPCSVVIVTDAHGLSSVVLSAESRVSGTEISVKLLSVAFITCSTPNGTIGSGEGVGVGSGVSTGSGVAVGDGLGCGVACGVGESVGTGVGESVGTGEGDGVGASVGVGLGVGDGDGESVGAIVGAGDGDGVGDGLGDALGQCGHRPFDSGVG